MLNLFYLSKNTYGGWVTYTAHLICGLQKAKIPFHLYKISSRTEKNLRPFGYGCYYKNLSEIDALNLVKTGKDLNHYSLITALGKHFKGTGQRLLSKGCAIVVHDPCEFINVTFINHPTTKYITIRKAVQEQIPGSYFIGHPYDRFFPKNTKSLAENLACSIARIDSDKKTHLLLEANRLLPKNKRIDINGYDMRIYSKNSLMPKFPEWQQSKNHYPRERTQAVQICYNYLFSVDMSVIKNDGGGTQYTFLESMDAGCVPIIHKEWIHPKSSYNEMIDQENCFIAANSQEIANRIEEGIGSVHRSRIIQNFTNLLEQHDAQKIATKIYTCLKG